MSDEVEIENLPQNVEANEQNNPPPEEPENHWREVRQALKSLKQQNIELQEQLNKRQTSPEPDEFEGLDPTDYVSLEQAKRLVEKRAEKRAAEIASKVVEDRLRSLENQSKEEKMRDRYDDYDYVIENFGIPMIENNPALKQALAASPNWAEMAYNLSKATPEYQNKVTQKKTDPAIERAKKNAERPVSSSAAPSNLKGAVDAFASLSPEEVWNKSQEYARRA